MELLTRTCKTDEMNVQRIMARVFVVIGGLFWVAMIWGAQWAYEGAPVTQALGYAAVVAAGIALVFVLGMFYENAAAIVLAVGALAVIVFGFVSGWESGVWGIAFFFFIVPMVIAAVLYALAARMQRICKL